MLWRGVRTVEQARQLFALGVEKVCLQTAALEDPKRITRISEYFGSQSVLVSIDIKKNWLGKRQVYTAATGKVLTQPWMECMLHLVAAGAGEVVLNSVDRDGVMQGMVRSTAQVRPETATKTLAWQLLTLTPSKTLSDHPIFSHTCPMDHLMISQYRRKSADTK